MARTKVTPVQILNPYKFSVRRAAAANSGNAAFAKIVWDTEEFDTNNNFATGTYTVPVAGFYQFNSYVNSITSTTLIISIFKNGAELKRGQQTPGISGGIGVATFVQLAASDTIEVHFYGGVTAAIDTGAGTNHFSGFLVCTT